MNMKSLTLFILISVIGLSPAWSASASGSLKGLDMKSCTNQKKKCFRLISAEASMSQLTVLYTFKKYVLSISEDNVTTSISGNFGYIDLVNRQVVVLRGNTNKEYSINLDTLLERDFSL